MILYFSATGNSEYVAKRIASLTKDVAVSVTDCCKKQIFSFEENAETLGIVSPTYAWGLPVIVRDFLRRLDLANKPKYIYFVATYGTTPGQSGQFAAYILKGKNLSFSARFCVKMPDTWTPIFDLSDKEKVKRINDSAEDEIDSVIAKIQRRESGDFMRRKPPLFLAKAVHAIWYDQMRKTKHFSVENTCVGCGLCAKNCPVSAIEIKKGNPVWVREQCVMCLSCLHRCPKFAIQYGRNTKKHGQYLHRYISITSPMLVKYR